MVCKVIDLLHQHIFYWNTNWKKKIWTIISDGGECKYITVNNYGVRWINNIKDNVICLNKQQIKDAVAYLLLNCSFTVGLKIFCQIVGSPMGSDPAPFLATYYYTSIKVSGWANLRGMT